MDVAFLNTLLKWVGIGGSGIGGAFALVFLWFHVRVKKNTDDLKGMKPICEEHAKSLQSHEVVLTEISTKQDGMIETQSQMFRKIDKLIEMHMDGVK